MTRSLYTSFRMDEHVSTFEDRTVMITNDTNSVYRQSEIKDGDPYEAIDPFQRQAVQTFA